MATVTQPTSNPTNKLSAVTVAVIVIEVAWVIIQNVWPTWASYELKAALMPLVVFLVGYQVKDAPNVAPEFTGGF